MPTERWQQIEELYRAAQNCPPGKRAELFARYDAEVRTQVERMLSAALVPTAGEPPTADFTQTLTETMVGVGSQFGPYRIDAILGAGGMGTVYRAIDTRLGRTVAIKISADRYSDRFEREARAISSLNHPHICTLYDVGPNYLVMELLDGHTLADEIKSGPLAALQTARIGAEIAGALTEAHAHGIVHRDLKPGNIMVTRHGVKVLDFGLAKVLSTTFMTETNAILGTPAYMAPEQVEGHEADTRTDLFALGLILYEMAVGKLPYPGASLGQMLSSGFQAKMSLPSQQREGVPANLDSLVTRLLQKDRDRRPQTASEVARELNALTEKMAAPVPLNRHRRLRWVYAVTGVLLLSFVIAGGFWYYQRLERVRWASEKAIPEITKLINEKRPLAAFFALRQAENYLPGDPQLKQIEADSTIQVSVKSMPPGARAEIQDYLSPNSAWFAVGVTPIEKAEIPKGYFRWRISKAGAGELIEAPPTSKTMQFSLQPAADSQPGMVSVPGGPWGGLIGFLGWVFCQIPDFDIDRYEVTNAKYQAFVDQGGYRKREFWNEPFVKDGKELAWEQAMDLFRDPTGRPGPSTWEGGHFPAGQDDYPVSGVSWYEAAAYAAFARKSLPVLAQWYKAGPPGSVAIFVANQSNFGGKGPIRVGADASVGPYGAYDMTGNVREWCLNAIEANRFILGGAWGTQPYQAFLPETLPPFDRSPLNGFRCVRNRGSLPPSASAPLERQARDFSKFKPVTDSVFQAYQSMYAYDRRPLDPTSEGIVENAVDWTKEKITIDAGYENERLPIFLFLPKKVRPPFQAIVFFPSARVNMMPTSRNLGDLQFVDYVIQSGRALAYPIYKETYERASPRQALPGAIEDLQLVIKESKEVRRAVDYLDTRSEIDKAGLAYLGISQGSAYGVIFSALEDRFKTAIFLDGGFFLGPALPARDQVNFAVRLKMPVLMINGRYDFTFPPVQSQEPMFNMLGTPASDKRRVLTDTPHDVSQERSILSREVLTWLDKYLGKVRN